MTHPLFTWFAAEILPHVARFRYFSTDTAGQLYFWGLIDTRMPWDR
jgi:hypothetical protein